MLRHSCSLLASLALVACASDPPRSFAPVDAAADDAAALQADAGPGVDAGGDQPDAGVAPDTDAGFVDTDAGPSTAPDAGPPPPACIWPDEIRDGATCVGVTRDEGTLLWSDVCVRRGGHQLEWRTLEEQARLQTVLFPRLPGTTIGAARGAAGWIWGSDRSPAAITWASPPMAGHTYASLTALGALGKFTHTGSGFCVRDVP